MRWRPSRRIRSRPFRDEAEALAPRGEEDPEIRVGPADDVRRPAEIRLEELGRACQKGLVGVGVEGDHRDAQRRENGGEAVDGVASRVVDHRLEPRPSDGVAGDMREEAVAVVLDLSHRIGDLAGFFRHRARKVLTKK